MPEARTQSLRRLLLIHELAFLTLVIITGALATVWGYWWQQSSLETIRLHGMSHTAEEIRSLVFKQMHEVTAAALEENPATRELDTRYLKTIQELFNELRRSSGTQTYSFTGRNQRFLFDWDRTEPASAFGAALTAFERQNYALALRELENLEGSDTPQADFLRGHIYFAQNRFRLAANAFEKTRSEGSLRYGDAAMWYQALCLVAQGVSRKAAAIQLLETITGDDRLAARIASLRAHGFRVAIDDLGAGYNGLNAFAELSPDIVKFDMALCREVVRGGVRARLVAAVAEVCRDLGILTVAEGIETDEQARAMTDFGCDLLQGYLFGHPKRPTRELRLISG